MLVPLSHLARKLLATASPGGEWSVPGLLWEAPTGTTTDAESWEMTSAGAGPAKPRAGEPLVLFVEKTAGANNPFSMGVTVGRVETNDLAIDDGSVSRFHAWLQRDERTQQWSLTDAESKNGTFVDGAQLVPRQRTVLRDGAKVKFGDVEVIFMLPATLKAFVEERLRSA